MSGPTIRPELSEHQLSMLQSSAEAKFYRACKNQLKDKYLVLHSISWVQRTLSGELRDGEADFAIFDPDGGFAVIEIKGGEISHDPIKNAWCSKDRNSQVHEIKNPFKQAVNEKHAILEQIRGHKEWGKYIDGRLLATHGVFFPDLDDVRKLVLPESPREIIGARGDLENLQGWLEKLFVFWSGRESNFQPMGKAGMSIVNDLFCREIYVRPLLKAELQEEEEQRIRLTEQQARTLRMLSHRKKAAISGGAGTGKTLLAIQRAKELAESGKRTLLLCYNQPLGEWLKASCTGVNNLRACNFHKLCEDQIAKVRDKTNRNLLTEARQSYPGADQWDVLRPFALAASTEILDEKYDAIVIDEGQDFKDEFWLGISMLFEDEESGYFYIFYDDNQKLYKRSAEFPINEPPFVLTINCRNTKYIHNYSYKFYAGDPIDPPSIPGKAIEFIGSANLEKQASSILTLINNLLLNEGVSSEQIVVLIDGKKFDATKRTLISKPLPKPYEWSLKMHRVSNTVLIESIARFKGLEADVVILWGVDNLDKEADRETIYVATSRAKSRLFIFGSEATCSYLSSIS